MSNQSVKVARLEDVPDSRPTIVTVDHREIVLIRRGPKVYALRNVCPHMSESFAAGFVRPKFVSACVGSAEMAADPVLVCPWHGWEYNVATGKSPTDPRLRVRTYATRVEGGDVLVEMGADQSPRVSTAGAASE